MWTTYFDKGQAPAKVASLADRVPEPVQVGYHLCYGDAGHRHFKEPDDTKVMVDVANGIIDNVHRSIEWFHMPVPRRRTDAAYFEPVRNLRVPSTTDL